MWQSGGRGLRAWRRRALALGAALLLGWAALRRAPARLQRAQRFPSVPPHRLAHYLADFSNHVLLYPRPESWAIETERSNFTWWQYEVSYSCGAHCVGRAAVTAHGTPDGAVDGGEPVPRHGRGSVRRHRVLAQDARCTRLLPLSPWPALCEETETETIIVGDEEGSGSRLTESAAARCSALSALLARCAGAAELAARHARRLRALYAALAPHQ